MADTNNITARILDAISIMNKGAISSASYDTTIKAVILNAVDTIPNAYKVSYLNSEFIAYAKGNESYYKNDVVYIQVPQGNFDNQKLILMKESAADDNSGVFNLRLPFDDFIGLYNLSDTNFTEHSFLANKTDDKYRAYNLNGTTRDNSALLLYEYPNALANTPEYAELLAILAKAAGSSKLGIELDILTLFNGSLSSGDYGLQIIIEGISKTSRSASSELTRLTATFMTADMYGNPYNYNAVSTQLKVLDISDFISISRIKIYFDLDLAFADAGGNRLSYLINGSDCPDNIIFSNLNVFLGFTADELEEDKVIIYTYDPISYGGAASDEKTLHLAWVHKFDTGFQLINEPSELPRHVATHEETNSSGEKSVVYDDYTTIDAKIYWYKYSLNATTTNNYGGANWELLNSDDETDIFNLAVTPDIHQNRTRYKAVVVYQEKVYECQDILLFENLIDVASADAEVISDSTIIIKGFSLNNAGELVENSLVGNFCVYDGKNKILSDLDKQDFYLLLYYLDDSGDTMIYRPLSYLKDYPDYSIDWHDTTWPTSLSMVTSWREPDITDMCSSNELKPITRIMRISSVYNINSNDNTITATVHLNGKSYTVRKELMFGHAGTMGTKYTATIEAITRVNNTDVVLKNIVKGAAFTLRCRVFDENHQEVVPSANDNWTYQWLVLGLGRANAPGFANSLTLSNSTLLGTLTNMVPPIVSVTIAGICEYPITATRGLLVYSSNEMSVYDFNLPDRVEFKSDGSTPIYYSNTFSMVNTSSNLLIYPIWYLNNTNFFKLKEELETGGTAYKLLHFTNQWTDSLATFDNFTYLYCSSPENITWMAALAIVFTLNVYASSLVNTWDGQSLDIDEENGTLLGTMFAAGSKDQRNRFTGVIMGNAIGDESLDSPGLYGYQSGQLTFGFKKDGTGFIGPSGSGRIEFNGKKALISNAAKTNYINLNPIDTLTSLADVNNGSYSPYFLYSQSNKTATDSNWTHNFVNDDTHDYFVVDPQHGVFTSGSIIAKDGYIGSWEINKNGLSLNYDEYSKYTYLGYSPMSEAELQKAQSDIEVQVGQALVTAKSGYDTSLASLDNTYYGESGYIESIKSDYEDDCNELLTWLQIDQGAVETARDNALDLIDENYDALVTLENVNYSTNMTAINNAYDSLVAVATNTKNTALNAEYGKTEPVAYLLDPLHSMNAGNAFSAVAEFLVDILALGDNDTTPDVWQNLIDTYIEDLLNLENYKKEDHYHYHYEGDLLVRDDAIYRTGWIDTIISLFNNRYKVSVSGVRQVRSTDDDYGPVFYNDYTRAHLSVSIQADAMTTNRRLKYYRYNKNNGVDVLVSDDAHTIITPNGAFNDVLTVGVPWSKKRLQQTIIGCVLAYNYCDHGSLSDLTGNENPASLNGYQYLLYTINQLVKNYIAPSALLRIETAYTNSIKAAQTQKNSDSAAELLRHTERLEELEADKENQLASEILKALSQLRALDENYQNTLQLYDALLSLAIDAKNQEYNLLKDSAEVAYNNLITQIKKSANAAIKNIYSCDLNKYGIYIGDAAVEQKLIPLFGVRWDGTMYSRKGQLGYVNPWVISDDGMACTIKNLTSTKNNGTIFIGNPEKDAYHSILNNRISHQANMPLFKYYYDEATEKWISGYYSIYNENDHSQDVLYDGTDLYDEEYVSDENNGYIRKRTEYLGTLNNSSRRIIEYLDNSITRLDSDEQANFAIYAGSKTIKFGITMDGYLYAHHGDIAGWSIEDDRLIKKDSNGLVNIELNSKGYINLYNNMIQLDGTIGRISIGKDIVLNQDGSVAFGIENPVGKISLAGFRVDGGSGNLNQISITGTVGEGELRLLDLEETATNDTIKINYNYFTSDGNSVLTGPSLSFLYKAVRGNTTNKLQGVSITTSTSLNEIAMSPTWLEGATEGEGYLSGWNFCGKKIFCTDGYIYNNEDRTWDKIATEKWVVNTALVALNKRIGQLMQAVKAKALGALSLTLANGNLKIQGTSLLGSVVDASVSLVNLKHAHITYCSDGKLYMVSGYGDSSVNPASIFTSDGFNATIAGTTVFLSLLIAGALKTVNFNIADTAVYQQNAFGRVGTISTVYNNNNATWDITIPILNRAGSILETVSKTVHTEANLNLAEVVSGTASLSGAVTGRTVPISCEIYTERADGNQGPTLTGSVFISGIYDSLLASVLEDIKTSTLASLEVVSVPLYTSDTRDFYTFNKSTGTYSLVSTPLYYRYGWKNYYAIPTETT